jgi:hypothetical protein
MKHNDAELMDIESNVQDIVRTPQTAPHLNTETNILFFLSIRSFAGNGFQFVCRYLHSVNIENISLT